MRRQRKPLKPKIRPSGQVVTPQQMLERRMLKINARIRALTQERKKYMGSSVSTNNVTPEHRQRKIDAYNHRIGRLKGLYSEYRALLKATYS